MNGPAGLRVPVLPPAAEADLVIEQSVILPKADVVSLLSYAESMLERWDEECTKCVDDAPTCDECAALMALAERTRKALGLVETGEGA